MQQFILAIDQGTSSTKSLVFDSEGTAIAKGTEPLFTSYSDHGFVEQDPLAIYENVLTSVAKCIQKFEEKGFSKNDIAAVGISNQRETFVVWDSNGTPLHPAIVWQCKRSVSICDELIAKGLSDAVNEKTGLIIDPYFSATKLIWLLRNNADVASAIKHGKAYFGTIDTWLLYKLTNGATYATDHTNASRTLFFNLHTLNWDLDLIEEFGLTGIQLPQIKPSSAIFGQSTIGDLFQRPIPIAALVGDSHAAAFGEGCYNAGVAKITLGTGSSILMNIGSKPLRSTNGMVTTVCWSVDDRIDFAFEGVIVSCGATLEWLKNELALFNDSRDTEVMATSVPDSGGVYLIPAFSGLGSPHWQMDRRASISGISFGTTKNHIVRAALESIPFQIKDVIVAMEKDAGMVLQEINTDGGITENKMVMQFLSDLLNINVATIGIPDVSALGAALLAGLKSGVYKDIEYLRKMSIEKKYFRPLLHDKALTSYLDWQKEIEQYVKK